MTDPLDHTLLQDARGPEESQPEDGWRHDPAHDPWTPWLAARERRTLHLPEFRRAAVLVALSAETPARVLLTLRSGDLPTHQGQVSFAGGSLEAGETPVRAALREAWEEVALPPRQVQVLGELDDVYTPLGFHVTPVLARFDPAAVAGLRGNAEVAQVLLPTLVGLRAAERRVPPRRLPDGTHRPMYEYWPQGVRVWGMTAHILHGLLAAAEELRLD